MTCKRLKSVALAATLLASMAGAQAQVSLLAEGFDDVAGLQTRGWTNFNGSSLPVSPGFGQGDGASFFPAQSGGADSYAFSGFAINGATDAGGNPTGEIYAALVTPTLALDKAVTLSFWTRSVQATRFPDRLAVSVYIDGVQSELLSVNYSLLRGGYPRSWTEYSVALSGQGAGVTGNFVFEYYIPDAATQGNYIGLDTVSVQAVPEPGTWLMMGLGLAGLGLLRRRGA